MLKFKVKLTKLTDDNRLWLSSVPVLDDNFTHAMEFVYDMEEPYTILDALKCEKRAMMTIYRWYTTHKVGMLVVELNELPLCNRFLENGCTGCPVYIKTGLEGCASTSWETFNDGELAYSDVKTARELAKLRKQLANATLKHAKFIDKLTDEHRRTHGRPK